MEYRTLGRTGVRISIISLGGWLTYGKTMADTQTKPIVRKAFDLGINYIDTADVYSLGQCEKVLSKVLKGVTRSDYVLASKVYWPVGEGVNDKGLSRKHIMEACEASLRRLKTDYLDLYYCHRYDDDVPLEETVHAMEDLVSQGKILYWGVSCWSSGQILDAMELATRHKPVVNQPPYNVFDRNIEKDVLATCDSQGLGVVVWSPLAQGVLTGKYLKGKKKGTRASNKTVNRFMEPFFTPDATETVRKLADLAKEAGMTTGQLSLGWCLRRPEVTSVIVGATKLSQIKENAGARPLPDDLLARVEEVVSGAPLLKLA